MNPQQPDENGQIISSANISQSDINDRSGKDSNIPTTFPSSFSDQTPVNALEDKTQISNPEVPPSQVTEELPASPPVLSKKTPFSKLLFILFAFVFLLISAGVGTLYAIAYEKVELPVPKDLQNKIAFAVQSLPFTPKTAKFLLIKSTYAQRAVESNSFDISAALSFSGSDSLLGLNNIDFAIIGDSDIQDETNIKTSFNMSITKDFNMDFRKKDQIAYFKVNKVPPLLFAFVGLDVAVLDPLLNKWVAYDTTPLQTDARKLLDESKDNKNNEEPVEESLERLFDKKVQDEIEITETTVDGHKVYSLNLNATDELVNHFAKKVEQELSQGKTDLYLKDKDSLNTKLSDTLKNVKLEMLIDKNSYYTRKVSFSFDLAEGQNLTSYNPDNQVLGDYISAFSNNGKTSFAMVTKLDNFGKSVNIEVPEESITFEEFSRQLSETVRQLYSSSLNQTTP